jgi:glycosyltransferase involved in cell wall biosynthesis
LDVHTAGIVTVDAGENVESGVGKLVEVPVSVSTGVDSKSLLRRVWLTLNSLYRLWNTVRSRDVDVISTNGYKAALLASLIVPFTNAKLVVRVHAKRFYRDYPVTSRYITYVADTTLHVSNYTAALAWPRERTAIVRSPIDSTDDLEQGDGTTVRAEFEAIDGPLIGLIGRVEPVKGHEYLLDVVPQLKETYEDLTVLVVGDIDMGNRAYAESLRTMVKQKGLEDTVVFTGFREDIPDILDALDLLVVTSEEENVPKVIQEALIAKTPVVAHDVGGVSELITAETGWLVPQGSQEALYDAIHTVLSSPEVVAKRVARGKEMALEKHEVSHVTNKEETVYHRLLESRQ